MVKLETLAATKANSRKNPGDNGRSLSRHRRLASMGRKSAGIINELESPIDSINRFINLALQTIGENSQSRQFLLESKQGIRKTSHLLKRLNDYAKKIEKEFLEISKRNGRKTDISSK